MGEIEIVRRKNVPLTVGSQRGSCVVNAMQFHPTSDLLLTAGRDKTLRFFSVDGEENSKVSSHFFQDFQIRHAAFVPSGDQVILTGVHGSRLWSFDVMTGSAREFRFVTSVNHGAKTGYCGMAMGPSLKNEPGLRSSKLFSVLSDSSGAGFIADQSTKHCVRTIQMAARGVAAAFSPSRDTLFTADIESNIYEWDLGSGRCLQRSKNTWATGITRLDISSPSAFAPKPLLAVGTATGNVDLFDLTGPRLNSRPDGTVSNLTTACDTVRFHPSSEVLAIASSEAKSKMRLVHTRSNTVFQNWPTTKTPLGRVSAVDFSPKAGYMAVGNDLGHVLLYQLGQYV